MTLLADILGTTWFIVLVSVLGLAAGAYLWRKFGHKL